MAEHLAPFLPGHPVVPIGGERSIDAVSAAPWGSASILLISWAYIKMLGGTGLSEASAMALLNANYMAQRLKDHYTVRYKNVHGRVAHELLIDLAEFDKAANLKVTDFAKRLQVRSLLPSQFRFINISYRTMGSIPPHVRGPYRAPCLLNQQSQRR